MLVSCAVAVSSLTMYAAFGPPLRPPPRTIGTLSSGLTVGIVRTRPCFFFVAWSHNCAHYFIHDNGEIEEILWDAQTSLTEKVEVMKGLVAWHKSKSVHARLELIADDADDQRVWNMARA